MHYLFWGKWKCPKWRPTWRSYRKFSSINASWGNFRLFVERLRRLTKTHIVPHIRQDKLQIGRLHSKDSTPSVFANSIPPRARGTKKIHILFWLFSGATAGVDFVWFFFWVKLNLARDLAVLPLLPFFSSGHSLKSASINFGRFRQTKTSRTSPFPFPFPSPPHRIAFCNGKNYWICQRLPQALRPGPGP